MRWNSSASATGEPYPWAYAAHLAAAKTRVGDHLGSAATRGEGRQNLLCAYLSAALLAGLAANALAGLWWADPVAALAIAAVALKEGRDAWHGEGCCRDEACGC